MALINCPECSHQVSDSASACVNCGHPIVALEQSALTAGQEARAARVAIRLGWIISISLAVLTGVSGLLGAIESRSLVALVGAMGGALIVGYLGFGIYWGVRGVRTLIPRGVFLFLPIVGWMAYWAVKIIVAHVYGILGGGIYEYLKRKKQVSSVGAV